MPQITTKENNAKTPVRERSMYQDQGFLEAIASLILLVVIGFGLYFWGKDKFSNNAKFEEMLIEFGYKDVEFVSSEYKMTNLNFQCVDSYNNDPVTSTLVRAVKNNTLREMIICNNSKRAHVYDPKEIPDFPLLVTEASAKEAYALHNNTKAVELVDKYFNYVIHSPNWDKDTFKSNQ